MEDRGISSPVLVELGRELNEVTRHRRSGETRVPGIRKHAVERVAKLVKHGGDIRKLEQGRLARGRFGEISDVVDNRKRTQQLGLADQIAHPGPTILVVPLEIVTVKERQGFAIRIFHFEDPYVGVVHGKVFTLMKCQPVELVVSVEDSVLEYLVEFEVGPDLGIFDI